MEASSLTEAHPPARSGTPGGLTRHPGWAAFSGLGEGGTAPSDSEQPEEHESSAGTFAPGSGPRPRIMIVEDDRGLRQSLRRALSDQGFEVEAAGDAYAATERVGQFRPHLVVLDLMLPRGDGLELARRLRRRPGGSNLAIVILTAKDSVADRLEGFEAGADDYVVKPVSMAELVARVKAQLRHVWSPAPEVLQFEDVKLDTGGQVVERGGRQAELTTTEYHLLELFMRRPQQVLSRRFIGEQLWGTDFEAESNVIDVYVRRLRRKLEPNGERPLIHTVSGSGYVLRAAP